MTASAAGQVRHVLPLFDLRGCAQLRHGVGWAYRKDPRGADSRLGPGTARPVEAVGAPCVPTPRAPNDYYLKAFATARQYL